MAQQIKFINSPPSIFYESVKKNVEDYFVKNNISPNANWWMYFKTFFFLSILVTSYVLLFTADFPLHFVLLMWAFMGFCSAFIGVNICHDAIHGAYSKKKWVNKFLGYGFNIVGANSYMWNITHNIVHHTYTNIDGIDEDLEAMPILRLTESMPKKKIHRFQHFYAFLLYGLASLSWVMIKDYKKFFQKKIGNYDNKHHPVTEYVQLFAFKAFYYFMFIALPIIILQDPWWYSVIGFFVMHFFEGYTLAIIFMLAHLVEETHFPVPNAEGNIENNWAVHQMYTTADFARKNPVAAFFTGGLNFQVEHHLFPKVCHVHYPAISEIVKKTAEEHQVPYLENQSFFSAIGSHIRFLKRMGRG